MVQFKMKSQLNIPYGALFNINTGMGLGLRHPESIYDTCKIVNLMDCLQSPNVYCRVTTRETLDDIQRDTGLDVLRPRKQVTATSMHKYPLHYMEAGRALST